MPGQFPIAPWRVPDETPVCDRVKLLNDLATDGMRYPAVRSLATWVYQRARFQASKFADAAKSDATMRQTMAGPSWWPRLLALEALRTVQSLPYVHDPVGEEWLQTANFTMTGGPNGIPHGGDCKDLSVLLVAIDRLLGLRAEPYWVTQNGQSINHVTARVWLDGKWFWEDGSIRGAMLGESPYEAEARLGSGVAKSLHAAGKIVAPAGKGGGGGGFHGGGFGGGFHGGFGRGLFGWWGWNGLWGGWPQSWWCYYYPYLCAPYSRLTAFPYAYGFYPIGIQAGYYTRPAYDQSFLQIA